MRCICFLLLSILLISCQNKQDWQDWPYERLFIDGKSYLQLKVSSETEWYEPEENVNRELLAKLEENFTKLDEKRKGRRHRYLKPYKHDDKPMATEILNISQYGDDIESKVLTGDYYIGDLYVTIRFTDFSLINWNYNRDTIEKIELNDTFLYLSRIDFSNYKVIIYYFGPYKENIRLSSIPYPKSVHYRGGGRHTIGLIDKDNLSPIAIWTSGKDAYYYKINGETVISLESGGAIFEGQEGGW